MVDLKSIKLSKQQFPPIQAHDSYRICKISPLILKNIMFQSKKWKLNIASVIFLLISYIKISLIMIILVISYLFYKNLNVGWRIILKKEEIKG